MCFCFIMRLWWNLTLSDFASAVVYQKVTNLSIKTNEDRALCNLLLFEPILKLAVNWAHLPTFAALCKRLTSFLLEN